MGKYAYSKLPWDIFKYESKVPIEIGAAVSIIAI